MHNIKPLCAIIASLSLSLCGCAGFSRPPVACSLPTETVVRIAAAEPRSALPAPKLKVNYEVKREMKQLLKNEGRIFSLALSQREQYYPLLKRIFSDEGVPEELLNVALIESNFNPNARSRAGAVGMWQFMKSTGRLYGLIVSRVEDQRRDPILSTIAAARHLRDLYEEYTDWYLALAAYNAGLGKVGRAMHRTGSQDFWTLARRGRLRRETARYIPKFIAATLIVNNLAKHGLEHIEERLEAMRAANGGTDEFSSPTVEAQASNRTGNRHS